MAKLVYGLAALVALATLTALAPGAAADPIVDERECTPSPLPYRCVSVYSDPLGGCVVKVWIHPVGGTAGCIP